MATPSALLQSQRDTLEPPHGEPGVIAVDQDTVACNLASVRGWLHLATD